MWPKEIPWQDLRFGVEFEFVGGKPEELELLPGWNLYLNERQVDENGEESGAEVTTPPLSWNERAQVEEVLRRLVANGARANWSCGLHVHVGVEPWGSPIIVPLLDAALRCQEALRELFGTPEHRYIFCPFVTPEQRERYLREPVRESLRHRGRPQSHRCGINAAAWFDTGTVEIRFANGSLEYGEVVRTVELCLKFVAAVGRGADLPSDADGLARALDVPRRGYPPPAAAPLWHMERMWLEDLLIPQLADAVEAAVPGGEVLHVRPSPHGLRVVVEGPEERLTEMLFRLVGGKFVREA